MTVEIYESDLMYDYDDIPRQRERTAYDYELARFHASQEAYQREQDRLNEPDPEEIAPAELIMVLRACGRI